MKKIKLIFICIITSVIVFVTYNGYHIYKYIGGVKSDTEKLITIKKQLLWANSFSGRVVAKNKIVMKDDDITKYYVIIQLDSGIKGIEKFPNNSFFDYYRYDNLNRKLELMVPSAIYNVVSKESKVIKKDNSDSLVINDNFFLFLNNNKLKWIP